MKGRPGRYNGWRNYETWNVALWLANDVPLYNAALSAARAVKGRLNGEEATRIVRELLPNGTPDIAEVRLQRVHWPEIARMLREWKGEESYG